MEPPPAAHVGFTPTGLPRASKPAAENSWNSSAVIVTGVGVTSIRARTPTETRMVAVSWITPAVAVTVKVPTGVGVYRPAGLMLPPSTDQVGGTGTEFPFASRPAGRGGWGSPLGVVGR